MSERIKKAKRRYRLEILGAMALYVAVLFAAKIISRNVEDDAVLALLSLAPVLPVILAVAAFFRFFFSMDERDRRISADAAAITLTIGVLTSMTFGFLSAFGVFTLEDDMMWFAPFLILLWGVIRIALGGRDC
ncbi:MAG: hypothetical protein ACE5FO_03425 [Parvularculaceae bacterium]